MLELRPNCEYCDVDLPPDSPIACICTYECTFCRHCVEQVLNNVCPNCGGGFEARPIRPANEYRAGLSCTHQPASTERVHSPYSRQEIDEFAQAIKSIPPLER